MRTGMTDQGTPLPWHRAAAAAIPMHSGLKSVGTAVFISAFFVAYFHLLRHPAHLPVVVPVIWLDRLVGFQPLALPLYFSLWLYVSMLPAFFAIRSELYVYGAGMTAMCLAGLAVFYFLPNSTPVPEIDWSQYPNIDFLKNIDAAGNACPSLHVATAFYSGAWIHRLLQRFGAPSWTHIFNWAWCTAIIYSTLAIRQHVALDVVAGLALAALAAWLSMRTRAAAARAVAPAGQHD